MSDPELEVIRHKRLQELQNQNVERNSASQKDQSQIEEMRSNLLVQILDAGARQRLNRICFVNPEKLRFIEDNLLYMAKTGQIQGKVNEEQLVQLLNQINEQEQAAQSKITSENKAYKLRTLSKSELVEKLNDLKHELLTLRVQKVAGGAANKISKINHVRKSIVSVMIVINQTQRVHLKQLYAKKKFAPLDLRPKLTRALRRQLTKKEKSIQTDKERKKQMNFPLRKYAIKV